MVEVAGSSSTTSRRFERMLCGIYAIAAEGFRLQLGNGKWYADWQQGLHGNLYGYSPKWWEDEIVAALAARCAAIGSVANNFEWGLAQMLSDFYPDIESVRWMVNGSDPCAAAAKLARAVTGRSKLLVYGYHGTANAYCAPPEVNARPGMPIIDMRRGTLHAEREAFVPLDWLEISYNYSDLDLSEYAAIVIECPPDDIDKLGSQNWLHNLANCARRGGALFILDEVVTGFRYGPGGAAEYYGLQGKVDLYCFGKTLGNGFPVACLAGKRTIMQELTKGVHFSGTFFGFPLGLATVYATLKRLREEPPWPHLYEIGEYLKSEWNALPLPYKLTGHPTRPIIDPDTVDDHFVDLRRHLFKRGQIVVDHPWYVTTATEKSDIDALIEAAGEWRE